ncbi:hypothetical protein SAMN04488074_13731 [Lentzea albidocapillata subsp. violacea]|uniref:HIRAN domain-containing protein n=1 Tax=Lentzea albidocapillata subsp. violacea TaxID=128104 RepID=A0A1G9Z675_9PSEU|nr:hypothetical protein [Lentzea albidocapillata]SDN16535.1 hypothetical protein SAMN04488074_13731 [Lentzea albidocapillata subsp. violacea]
MYDCPITTVGELREALEPYDPTAPLQLATQPGYPLAHALTCVVSTLQDTDDDAPPTHAYVVWLGAGEQVGYLPQVAVSALGWSS